MKRFRFLLMVIIFLLCISACGSARDTIELMPLVRLQTDLGPRTPGSEAHAQFITQASAILEESGWKVTCEAESWQKRTVKNIVAERGADTAETWIVVGAHYDSRITADQETMQENKMKPVPAANDGASGAAVLLGLAKTLPDLPEKKITLAFFDAEDQGKVMGWPDWCLGSRLLAEKYGELERKPDAVIVIDMIGDADLNIYRERNSDKELTDTLFAIANKLGFSKKFIDSEKYTMYDGHIPFLDQGIPAADLIDFDYPWWHTLSDTADKLSEESLQALYSVLFAYLTGK